MEKIKYKTLLGMAPTIDLLNRLGNVETLFYDVMTNQFIMFNADDVLIAKLSLQLDISLLRGDETLPFAAWKEYIGLKVDDEYDYDIGWRASDLAKEGMRTIYFYFNYVETLDSNPKRFFTIDVSNMPTKLPDL